MKAGQRLARLEKEGVKVVGCIHHDLVHLSGVLGLSAHVIETGSLVLRFKLSNIIIPSTSP